jgi:hypothetical protein
MGKLKILLALILFSIETVAQLPAEYTVNIHVADSLYYAKHYNDAAPLYNQAFRNRLNVSTDVNRYNAAYCWAKRGNADSALTHLYILANMFKYSNIEALQAFNNTVLHGKRSFAKILSKCACNKAALQNKVYHYALGRFLDSLYIVDQTMRTGLGSEDTSIHIKVQPNSQALNIKALDSIYLSYGFLTEAEVGYNGAAVQFLVIQHDDVKTMRKWLPRIKQAVAHCMLPAEDLALLTDRILVFSGHKQMYGTQLRFDTSLHVYVPHPIKHPASVNKRRRAMGMLSLQAQMLPYR